MDKTLKVGDNMESIEHGHSLEKRRADDLDEEERQLEALIEEVYSSMGVKASLKEYSYVYAFLFSQDVIHDTFYEN